MRWCQPTAWALTALALCGLPVACLGGQTGQPMSGSDGCIHPTVNVPVDRPVRGVIPIDAALSLEGTLVEPLAWLGPNTELFPALAQDELSLTFRYEGGPAAYDPCASGGPKIEMLLEVASRDTHVVESTSVWVSFYPPRGGPEPFGPSGAYGEFHGATSTFWIDGRLFVDDAGATSTTGTLRAPTPPVPDAYGAFGTVR